MADVTYADALAALRAECGAPTECAMYHGVEMADWYVAGDDSRGGVCLGFDGEVLMLSTHESYDGAGGGTFWTLAGCPESWAALTPLADAVRDAGAWLRGAGAVGRG